jgi:hypothetical protein
VFGSDVDIDRIELVDLSGKTIYQQFIRDKFNHLEIQLGDIFPGVYYVLISYKGNMLAAQKIIKQ